MDLHDHNFDHKMDKLAIIAIFIGWIIQKLKCDGVESEKDPAYGTLTNWCDKPKFSDLAVDLTMFMIQLHQSLNNSRVIEKLRNFHVDSLCITCKPCLNALCCFLACATTLQKSIIGLLKSLIRSSGLSQSFMMR